MLCTVYIHRLIRNQARNSAENWAELSVLNNIEHWGSRTGANGVGALSQKELANHEQVSQAAMSNTIKKLRARDLVRCDKSESDARSLLVSLTPKGRRHLAKQGPLVKEVFDQLLESLSPTEIKTLAAGQRILSDALKQSAAVQAVVTGDPTAARA